MAAEDEILTIRVLLTSRNHTFGKIKTGKDGVISEFTPGEIAEMTFEQIDLLRAAGHTLRAVDASDNLFVPAADASNPAGELQSDSAPAAPEVSETTSDDTSIDVTHDMDDTLGLGTLSVYRVRAGATECVLPNVLADTSPLTLTLPEAVEGGDVYFASSRWGASAEVKGDSVAAIHEKPVISPAAAADTHVDGTAADGDEGATVTLYRGGSTLLGTAVIASGAWSVTGLTLTAGWSLTAVVGSGDTISPTSDAVVVSA